MWYVIDEVTGFGYPRGFNDEEAAATLARALNTRAGLGVVTDTPRYRVDTRPSAEHCPTCRCPGQ